MNAVIDQNLQNKNVTEFRMPGPGERLRSARLSLGLEAAKAAEQLHLHEDQIVAIEEDDFDKLPGRVFAQGYVKNYARLVGLPPESVLKQLVENWPEDERPRLRSTDADVRRELHSNNVIFQLVSAVILFGLIGMFFVWWKGYLTWIDKEDVVAVSMPQATAPLAGDDGQLRLPTLSADGATTTPKVHASSSPYTTVASESPAGDDNSLLIPARPNAAVTAAASAGSKTTTTDETGVRESASLTAAVESPATSSPTEPPVNAGRARIVFSFSEPCWVDVRGATGRFKLIGEMSQNSRQVLGGEPPYKIVVGKASAVRVTVDDVAMDINRYARGNVARFTLDPNQ